MQINPFDKYFSKEDNLHIAICNYIDMQYPKAVYTHCHNEAKRTKFERYKAKQLRMKPGIPDILIFNGRAEFDNHESEFFIWSGLALELKIKPNKPTENQKKWLEYLEGFGWQCHVIYDFDTAKNVIDNYLT